jgi:hypothetical protein
VFSYKTLIVILDSFFLADDGEGAEANGKSVKATWSFTEDHVYEPTNLLRETEQLKKGKSTFWTMNDIFLQI